MTTDDTIDTLRDELQRVRIERAGLVTDLEQLKVELAQLRTENETPKAELEARPQKRGTRKRKAETVAPFAAEIEAALDDLISGRRPDA